MTGVSHLLSKVRFADTSKRDIILMCRGQGGIGFGDSWAGHSQSSKGHCCSEDTGTTAVPRSRWVTYLRGSEKLCNSRVRVQVLV